MRRRGVLTSEARLPHRPAFYHIRIFGVVTRIRRERRLIAGRSSLGVANAFLTPLKLYFSSYDFVGYPSSARCHPSSRCRRPGYGDLQTCGCPGPAGRQRGPGAAQKHARSQRLTRPRLAVGKTSCPVDFKSADGKPVSLIFLLAVPEVAPQSHLRVLASLSRIALDKKFLRGLIKSSSAQELFELVAGIPV